jgi:hypothetical protein
MFVGFICKNKYRKWCHGLKLIFVEAKLQVPLHVNYEHESYSDRNESYIVGIGRSC